MHVEVTGKDFASEPSSTPRPMPEGFALIRLGHEVWGGRQEMTGPRVNGRFRAAFDWWEYPDGHASAIVTWTRAAFRSRHRRRSHSR
jgi:hypothetical protein